MRWPAVLLLFATACHGKVAGGRADGPAIFAEACARCHGDTGKPSESMVAQLHVRDLTSPEFRGRVTIELVENQVRKGSSNGIMPSFAGELTDEQIHALAAYVVSLGTAPR
jgi:mono/diheme cytochrome c family protein